MTIIKYFNIRQKLFKNLPLFFYLLIGRLNLTGVSIKNYDNEKRVSGDSYLYYNKPGIFNIWYIRESAKIAYEGKVNTELDYVFHKNFLYDLLLILKSIPAALYHQENIKYQETVNLFNINFKNITMKNAIDIIKSKVQEKSKTSIFFVNPDCLNKVFSDKEYFQVLHNNDLTFPDGIGVNIACKIIKNPLKENINGTDMFPYICKMAEENNFSIYLFGAKPGIAEKMKLNTELKYTKLNICGYRDGYFDNKTQNEMIIDEINSSNPDILFVAFGAPLQEKWIYNNIDRLNAKVILGVGGLFDFYSGTKARAPRWMREIGLEWVYRLLLEPGRMWKRYIVGNFVFIFRVIKWKVGAKHD